MGSMVSRDPVRFDSLTGGETFFPVKMDGALGGGWFIKIDSSLTRVLADGTEVNAIAVGSGKGRPVFVGPEVMIHVVSA